MTKPTPPDDLWDFLVDEAKIYTPPKGSFSISEYATKFGVSQTSADQRVSTLVKHGKLVYVGKFGPRYAKYYKRTK